MHFVGPVASFYMEVYHSKMFSQFCDEALSSMNYSFPIFLIPGNYFNKYITFVCLMKTILEIGLPHQG
jgi:hypothetical protein